MQTFITLIILAAILLFIYWIVTHPHQGAIQRVVDLRTGHTEFGPWPCNCDDPVCTAARAKGSTFL